MIARARRERAHARGRENAGAREITRVRESIMKYNKSEWVSEFEEHLNEGPASARTASNSSSAVFFFNAIGKLIFPVNPGGQMTLVAEMRLSLVSSVDKKVSSLKRSQDNDFHAMACQNCLV